MIVETSMALWIPVMTGATTAMVAMNMIQMFWFRQDMKDLHQDMKERFDKQDARFDRLEDKLDRLIEVLLPSKTPLAR